MVNDMLNKKSEANLEIAKLCLEKENENFYSVGASRAYYAIFQATKNLLEKSCFDYKQFKKNDPIANVQRDHAHGSMRRALEHFLRTNGFLEQDDLIFIKETHQTFKKLYNWRLKGDYYEAVIYRQILKNAIERAEMFINNLKKYNKGEMHEKKTETDD